MTRDPKQRHDPLAILNGSGYLFQLRVEHEVRRTAEKHRFQVLSYEHPWVRDREERVEFADMMLLRDAVGLRLHPIILVAECKRVKAGGAWVFVADPSADAKRTVVGRARLDSDGGKHYQTVVATTQPESVVASACAIRGSNDDPPSTLERIGANLLDSIDSITVQLYRILEASSQRDYPILLAPVVVTNATLYVSTAPASEVSIEDGSLPDSSAITVYPWVRFHKTLRFIEAKNSESFEAIRQGGERTLFVVNAASLGDFLESFHLWANP